MSTQLLDLCSPDALEMALRKEQESRPKLRCGCGTLLRLGNRKTGKCEACQRKDKAAAPVVYYSPSTIIQVKRIPKPQPDPCPECKGPVVGHKGKRFCTRACKIRFEAAAYRAKKLQ